MSQLTHFDSTGAAHMVDVSEKEITSRVAIAKGFISMQPATLALISEGRAKKGDVLSVARLAGIMAAKKTHDLIPLCHPLALSKIAVDLQINDATCGVDLTATVKNTGQTGVEMEALTAISIAALTVYDMVKAVDKTMVISDIRLVLKDGGKSGLFEAG